MAAVVKETSVLRVYLNDEAGGEKALNLDDYATGVTLTQVTEAFNGFFNSSSGSDPLLQTTSGLKLTSISRAETIDTRTTTTPLT